MKYNHIKKIHFVGIKGVGMSALAILAKEAGFEVTGSDLKDDFITDSPLRKAGILPLVGFSTEHVVNADLVIATGAHGGFKNLEVQFAKQKNIPVLMQGQAVGEFMKGGIFKRSLTGISIAGCHGKTTTTALTATLFREANLDPSFIIGTGDIPSLGGSGHYGQGEYFIAEADEYATEPNSDKTPKFLWQFPKYLIITNIDFDHPDLYKNINEVERAYELFLANIAKKGKLITNGDEELSRKILENYKGEKVSFGFNSNNNYVLSNVLVHNGKTEFSLISNNSQPEIFTTHLMGVHNALNTVASIILADQVGIPREKTLKGLLSFTGTKRRLEYKGRLATGAHLFDDYAHHPAEIKASLNAMRQFYPDKKIVCIFQPHTFSRTKKLFDQFIYSFEAADEVVITDIYASQREEADPSVSSERLIREIKKVQNNVHFEPDILAVVKYINQAQFDDKYCIITMGAGDIYKIDKLLKMNKTE